MLGPQQERHMHMSTQATTMQETNHASLKKGYSSALDQNFNTLNRPDIIKPSKTSFAEKRQNEENESLKYVVSKLSQKLKEHQLEMSKMKRENSERLGIDYEDPMDLVLSQANAVKNGVHDSEYDIELTNQLSHHVLGPLFDNYEATISLLERELGNTKIQLKSKLEECQLVVNDNDSLR